jgi:subtilisin family serine protease
VSEGARIINVSLGGDVALPSQRAAVQFAEDHGATIVAAVGNDGRDIDAKPVYPASFSSPAVFAVTATGSDGRLLDVANTGRHTVDLAAPGDMIATTVLGSDYEFRAGTSMAAPVVAGALALLSGARPDLPQADLRDALMATASHPGALQGRVASGMLDVAAAMHRIVPGTWGHRSSILLRWRARGAARSVVRWRITLGGRRVRTVPGRARRALIRAVVSGRHRWTVTGYDANGQAVARTRPSVSAHR